MTSAKAYSAPIIFTGTQWLHHHAVIVADGVITAVIPQIDVPSSISVTAFSQAMLVPAFIDLQVYGAFDSLFSVHRNTASLELLTRHCSKNGTAYCMPTVATNDPQVLFECMAAIRNYWQQGGTGILGLHAEGPWINKARRGAHIESLIHEPSIKEVKELLVAGKDVLKIITLAPEVCNPEIITCIKAAGIQVFAGHSDATYEQATDSFNNGITAVTHLYNAMSPLQHRKPGLVGAAFDHSKVMASIIPDGIHVNYAAVRIAQKMMQQRLFAITDAVTTTLEGYYKHKFEGDRYTSDNILSGSAITMYKALQNLVMQVGIDKAEALRMCSLYPAQAIQIDDQLGRIEKGYRAKIAVLPAQLEEVTVHLLP